MSYRAIKKVSTSASFYHTLFEFEVFLSGLFLCMQDAVPKVERKDDLVKIHLYKRDGDYRADDTILATLPEFSAEDTTAAQFQDIVSTKLLQSGWVLDKFYVAFETNKGHADYAVLFGGDYGSDVTLTKVVPRVFASADYVSADNIINCRVDVHPVVR